jgi:hypothetical protein
MEFSHFFLAFLLLPTYGAKINHLPNFQLTLHQQHHYNEAYQKRPSIKSPFQGYIFYPSKIAPKKSFLSVQMAHKQMLSQNQPEKDNAIGERFELFIHNFLPFIPSMGKDSFFISTRVESQTI